ncbi:M23 family metallopeptidase [Streptomyces cavernicola]|uniref:LysM peptidoglycan-binding domain-containing M23 family metallopeptidase n=1 Tax=Streptomyces cavernicola TaxID=3043613 RepID=A0ABT6S755_9ACTN|nr:M23 family metallopeptidase [Streptomyces sp. B-S-A6]MDI3403932.1 LysM peptidoglycan-binding domain-containing M23 family metallopeptidase [Streptomyces sp. B-S-A6]
MGLRGRHRRYRASRINRASLTVTAGGAGIALPLVGAGTGADVAHAADAHTWDNLDARAPDIRHRAAPRPAVRPETTPQSKAGKAELYTVVRGDSLTAIADAENVDGGWKVLYAANRKVIGADPDLIVPGQRLALRDGGTTADRAGPRAKPEPRPEPDPKPKGDALSAPVTAGIGTPYRASGGSWASGYHTGVDFAVPTGTSVRAVAGGRVVSAGWGGAYGYEVVIRHADGRYSQYAHLSALTVRAGQDVGSGQRIARSGSTGNSTGPHLHFEIRTGPGYGSDVDPLAYLRAGGVRI